MLNNILVSVSQSLINFIASDEVISSLFIPLTFYACNMVFRVFLFYFVILCFVMTCIICQTAVTHCLHQ